MKVIINLAKLAGFVVVSLCFAVISNAQQPSSQDRVAAFKHAVQQSMAGLRKYEWIETTTVLLKGDVKSVKQNRCYYGADGKIQKVPIETAQPQEQPSGRQGRIKSRVIAKKKEEMTDYMQQAVALVHQYVPPDPNRIQAAKDAGKSKVEPVEPNRIMRVSFNDFIKPGDLLYGTLSLESGTILDINISTWVESQTDGVTVAVTFARLQDGASYSKQTVLDALSKNIKVVVDNSGHRPLQ